MCYLLNEPHPQKKGGLDPLKFSKWWGGWDTLMYILAVESALLVKFSSFLLLEHKKGNQTYKIIEAECKYVVWDHFKPISTHLRLIIFKKKTIFYDFS